MATLAQNLIFTGNVIRGDKRPITHLGVCWGVQ